MLEVCKSLHIPYEHTVSTTNLMVNKDSIVFNISWNMKLDNRERLISPGEEHKQSTQFHQESTTECGQKLHPPKLLQGLHKVEESIFSQ